MGRGIVICIILTTLILVLAGITVAIYYATRETQRGPCPKGRFQCTKHHYCVPDEWTCDGRDDCGDLSDEDPSHCHCNTLTEYRCRENNRCISKLQVCDAIMDCAPTDGHNVSDDEIYCKKVCDFRTEIQCRNSGRCLPRERYGDGRDDCGDLSDEIQARCPGGRSMCADGTCYPSSSFCDVILDCRDRTDERSNCDTECESNGVYCRPGGFCVPARYKCDWKRHCQDWSDEEGCTNPYCPEDAFVCKDGSCIWDQWTCDGTSDCPLGEDEAPDVCSQCSPAEFQCKTAGDSHCIALSKKCDGKVDCLNSADESQCLHLERSELMTELGGATLHNICTEHWTMEQSKAACRLLGLGTDQVTFEEGPVKKGIPLVHLLSSRLTQTTQQTLIPALEKTTSCSSNRIVNLNCGILGCGTRAVHENIEFRIINGRPASDASWPWHALLMRQTDDKIYICSGTILNERWILTAAHCVDNTDIKSYSVYVGTTNLYHHSSKEVPRELDRIVTHAEYNPHNFHNDIALIHLTESLQFSDRVRPVCLPDINIDVFKMKVCVATGFGSTAADIAEASSWHLMEGRIVPLSSEKCIRVMMEIGTFYLAQLYRKGKTICSGDRRSTVNRAVCYGDSGGPLSCQNHYGVWFVMGVTSFGISDCRLNGFMNVGYYGNWIRGLTGT